MFKYEAFFLKFMFNKGVAIANHKLNSTKLFFVWIVIAIIVIFVLPVAFGQFIEPLPPGEGAIGGPGIQPGEPIEPPAPWPTAEWCAQAINCLSCQYKSGCYWNGFACALGRVTYSCPTAGGGGGGYASWDFSLTSNSYSKTFGSGETGVWTPTLRLQRLRGFGKTTVLRVELVGGPISNAPRTVFSDTGGDTFTQSFDPTKLSIFDIPVEISVLADTAPGTYRFRVVAEGADVTKTLTLTVLVEGPAVTQPAPSARMYCFEYTSCIDCTTYGEGCGWLNGNCVTARAFPGFGVIETPEDCSRTEAPPIQARIVEAFDFSISVSPYSQTTTSGGTVTYNVDVSILQGAQQLVNLEVWIGERVLTNDNEGLKLLAGRWSDLKTRIPWLSVDLSHASGVPPFTTTLTVSVNPEKNFESTAYFYLMIEGTSDNVRKKSDWVELVIEVPTPAPVPAPTTAAVVLLCDSTAQAVVDAVGGCSQIDQATYRNVYEACCKEITKETLLEQLDKTLEDGVIDDKEKNGLLYALNAYLS